MAARHQSWPLCGSNRECSRATSCAAEYPSAARSNAQLLRRQPSPVPTERMCGAVQPMCVFLFLICTQSRACIIQGSAPSHREKTIRPPSANSSFVGRTFAGTFPARLTMSHNGSFAPMALSASLQQETRVQRPLNSPTGRACESHVPTAADKPPCS
jgi:hypothetical protein